MTTMTAAAIAAAETEAHIVGMISNLHNAMAFREAIAAQHYTGEQYITELRAAYIARIEVYVEALAIARAAR